MKEWSNEKDSTCINDAFCADRLWGREGPIQQKA